MADNYFVNDTFRTVAVFGPNLAIDVQEVGFFTIPSNVYARVAVPLEDWLDNEATNLIAPMATGIEVVAGYPEVVGIGYEQDMGPNQQVQDLLVVTVQVKGTKPGQLGPFTGEVRAPTYAFAGQGRDYLVNVPIAAEVQRLQALANA